jgi:hypothetical protein
MIGHDGYGVVMLVVCVHAGRPWIRMVTVPTRADGDDTRSAGPLGEHLIVVKAGAKAIARPPFDGVKCVGR